MDAFFWRAPICSHFARLVAKLFKRNVIQHILASEPITQVTGSPFLIPDSLSTSFNSSAKDKHRKHMREKSIESDYPRDYAKTRGDQNKPNKLSMLLSSSIRIHASLPPSNQESVKSKIS